MKNDNDSIVSLAQALQDMKTEQGESFDLAKVNLAELERRCGISRAKLRRLKSNNFKETPHALTGRKTLKTVMSGYESVVNDLLRRGVKNTSVIYDRLKELGYKGSLSGIKRYVAANKSLIPPARHAVEGQGSRGLRYFTKPGEAFQMDWGFVKVRDYSGLEYQAACFAMICHHCGMKYIEFFPNAKQENLFIGMIHAFQYMGIPQKVLTDNMKSVVIKRDFEGRPVWNHDYEAFMKAVGFETKLCKPRHPFTKGKVVRLVRFVKENFIAGRQFVNVTDLNEQALQWCNDKNSLYRKEIDGFPVVVHQDTCRKNCLPLQEDPAILLYLFPERKISFDGFITYEGRRFGVPYSYGQSIVRVNRTDRILSIYSDDMTKCLVTHNVTWSRRDSFCHDQYVKPEQPEEFPTAPVKAIVQQALEDDTADGFNKFNFE